MILIDKSQCNLTSGPMGLPGWVGEGGGDRCQGNCDRNRSFGCMKKLVFASTRLTVKEVLLTPGSLESYYIVGLNELCLVLVTYVNLEYKVIMITYPMLVWIFYLIFRMRFMNTYFIFIFVPIKETHLTIIDKIQQVTIFYFLFVWNLLCLICVHKRKIH